MRRAGARCIENRRAQVTATAAIAALAGCGRKALRELDPFMRNPPAADPAALAAWLSAARIERPGTRARTGAQPAAPPHSHAPDAPAPPTAG